LVDKLVPTFGLDDDKKISYDTPNGMFHLVIKNGDLVQIQEPIDAKLDDISEKKRNHILRLQKMLYRELYKQARRLQEAFWDNRKWRSEDFEQIMLYNPILNTLAQGVLWARYQGDSVVSVFRLVGNEIFDLVVYREVKEGEFEIGIFHPVENTSHNWRELLDVNYTPFNQLNVEVFPLDTFNKFSSVVTRFRGNIVNGVNFEQKMLQRNWQHSLQLQNTQGGSFVIINEALNIIAEVEYVPFSKLEQTEDLSLGDLRFYKLDTAVKIGKSWQTNKVEALNIGQIPQRFFSDALYDVSVCSKK